MNQQLIPKQQDTALASRRAGGTPKWLDLLVMSYPKQKPQKEIMALLLKRFAIVPADTMMQATESYVSKETYFPTLAQLLPYAKHALRGQPIDATIFAMTLKGHRLIEDRRKFGELVFIDNITNTKLTIYC